MHANASEYVFCFQKVSILQRKSGRSQRSAASFWEIAPWNEPDLISYKEIMMKPQRSEIPLRYLLK